MLRRNEFHRLGNHGPSHGLGVFNGPVVNGLPFAIDEAFTTATNKGRHHAGITGFNATAAADHAQRLFSKVAKQFHLTKVSAALEQRKGFIQFNALGSGNTLCQLHGTNGGLALHLADFFLLDGFCHQPATMLLQAKMFCKRKILGFLGLKKKTILAHGTGW